jgi:hypothetical protein
MGVFKGVLLAHASYGAGKQKKVVTFFLMLLTTLPNRFPGSAYINHSNANQPKGITSLDRTQADGNGETMKKYLINRRHLRQTWRRQTNNKSQLNSGCVSLVMSKTIQCENMIE